jgi:hypothetical protein
MMGTDHRAVAYEGIAGGADLLRRFGHVPRFHDAEILSLALNRAGPSHLILRGWNMTAVIGSDGYFTQEKRAVVTFTIDGITDLQLEGFNHQNVLDGLSFTQISHGPNGSARHPLAASPGEFELLLKPCFGLSGHIRARGVSVGFVPDTP